MKTIDDLDVADRHADLPLVVVEHGDLSVEAAREDPAPLGLDPDELVVLVRKLELGERGPVLLERRDARPHAPVLAEAAVLRDDSGQPAALLVLNASGQAQQLPWPQEVGQLNWRLHPRLAGGADQTVQRQAKWLLKADGAVLAVPGLTAQVWVRAGR